MINIDCKWNFEADEIAWKELIGKSFPDLSTFNLKNNFKYDLNQAWGSKTLFKENGKKNDICLALLSDSLKLSHVNNYNIKKIVTAKNLKSYPCNSDFYNQTGLDGKWEIVYALHDLVKLWQKGKIPKVLNVLTSVNEDMFYQQVKILSLQLVLGHLLNVFKVKSQIKLDLIISDKMYNTTDPKNNQVRLSYALLAAIMINPAKIILRPLIGFPGADSWKLAAHAFNILTLETDLLQNANAFQGAPFFENSVMHFSQSIWEGLQYIFKLEDDQKRKQFIINLANSRKAALEKKIEQRDIKIIGVNEFIAPAAKMAGKADNSYASCLEKKRISYIKKFHHLFKSVKFNLMGDQNKLNLKLNEIYQSFAILNVNVIWEKNNLETVKSNGKSSQVYIVSNTQQTESLIKSWKNTKKILLVFENDNIVICYKNNIQTILYDKNPFKFLDNLSEVVK